MGRLKRYKKLKSCDPCAQKRPRGEEEDKYDLPPDPEDDDFGRFFSLIIMACRVCSHG